MRLLAIPPHLIGLLVLSRRYSLHNATRPCRPNLSLGLITTSVCDCRLFSNINVSLGSVATIMRRSGIFNNCFTANLLENLSAKEFGKSDKNLTELWP